MKRSDFGDTWRIQLGFWRADHHGLVPQPLNPLEIGDDRGDMDQLQGTLEAGLFDLNYPDQSGVMKSEKNMALAAEQPFARRG